MADDRDTGSRTDRRLHRTVLLGTILLGVLCLSSYMKLFEFTWDRIILPEIGKAFIIAGVLGVTIEPLLRKAMAKDVFRAAFGYNMPTEFRDELAQIASHRIICIRHLMEVRIAETKDNKLRVTLTIEREFKNLGNRPVLRRAYLHRDEWDFDEPTLVSRCEIRSGNRVKSGRKIPQTDATRRISIPKDGYVSWTNCHCSYTNIQKHERETMKSPKYSRLLRKSRKYELFRIHRG